jgi:hypothetical protein
MWPSSTVACAVRLHSMRRGPTATLMASTAHGRRPGGLTGKGTRQGCTKDGQRWGGRRKGERGKEEAWTSHSELRTASQGKHGADTGRGGARAAASLCHRRPWLDRLCTPRNGGFSPTCEEKQGWWATPKEARRGYQRGRVWSRAMTTAYWGRWRQRQLRTASIGTGGYTLQNVHSTAPPRPANRSTARRQSLCQAGPTWQVFPEFQINPKSDSNVEKISRQ